MSRYQSYQDWLDAKTEALAAAAASKAEKERERELKKAEKEKESTKAFSKWSVDKQLFEKALHLLGKLSGKRLATSESYRECARVLAAVQLEMQDLLSGVGIDVRRSSNAHSLEKPFLQWSRQGYVFDQLTMPAELEPHLAGKESLEKEESTGRVFLSSVSYTTPEPPSKPGELAPPLPIDSRIRNYLFNQAVNAIWQEALASMDADASSATAPEGGPPVAVAGGAAGSASLRSSHSFGKGKGEPAPGSFGAVKQLSQVTAAGDSPRQLHLRKEGIDKLTAMVAEDKALAKKKKTEET